MANPMFEARQRLAESTRRQTPVFVRKTGFAPAGQLGDDKERCTLHRALVCQTCNRAELEARNKADLPKLCALHKSSACGLCARIALAAQTELDQPRQVATIQRLGDVRK